MKTLFKHSFIRFALVGGLGFLLDLLSFVVLALLLPPLFARALSFWVAATSNWWWNKKLTFQNHPRLSTKGQLVQWLQFIGSSMLAFIPNWGCYLYLSTLTQNISIQPLLMLWPYLSLIPGVIIGMFINYAFARYWVFTPPSKIANNQSSITKEP
ncbi:GtrA family protein [Marinomonas sp.]